MSFDPGHTLIRRFKWSGDNSIESRRTAGIELTSKLSELIRDHRNAKHYIVAHSHGADVAIRAMNEESVGSHIFGFVALSAPFLRVSLRRWVRQEQGDLFRIFTAFLGLALLESVGFYLFKLLIAWPLPPNDDSWRWISSMAVVVSSVVIGALSIFFVFAGIAWFISCFVPLSSRWLWNSLYERAKSCVAQVRTVNADHFRVLVVRPIADEASAVLTVGQFLGWVTGYVEVIAASLLVPLSYFGFAILSWEKLRGRGGQIGERTILFGTLTLLSLILVSYFARLVVALPFGVSPGLFAPLLDISVESAPPGQSTFYQMPQGSRRLPGLFHSSTHDDPEVAGAIVKWLRSEESVAPKVDSAGKLCL
ncbi:MAG: hypothetical protein ABSE85_06785 [Candidatus Korobacteraceae bacterium]